MTAREAGDYGSLLFARAKTSHNANKIIQAQGQKQLAAEKKKNANAKAHDKAAGQATRDHPKPPKPKTDGMSAEEKKKATAAHAKEQNDRKKAINKAGAQGVTQAVKDKKTQRTGQWDKKKNTPDQKAAKAAEKAKNRADRKAAGHAPGPAKTDKKARPDKMTAEEKKAAAKHLKQAGQKMKETENIPGRKDSFTVSNAKSECLSCFGSIVELLLT